MKRVRRELHCTVAVALAVAMLATPGCGVRTAPRPPVETQARPPGKFFAKHAGESVELNWSRPNESRDGMKLRDLIGFLVERESQAVKTFEVIADIPVEDTYRIRPQQNFTFIDSNPPAGRLRYRVRAYAKDGQIGLATPIAAVTGKPQ
jgi:hypothetical protein